jgi:hypothetical protein
MPQDLNGGDYALGYGNYLEGRNSDGTTAEKFIGIDKDGYPCRERLPRTEKYDFTRTPYPLAVARGGGGAATGTEGDINLLSFPGLTLEYAVIGTQTILAPGMTAVGFDLNSQDQTDNDGVQYSTGLLATSPHTFTIGTSPAFYFEVQVKLEDVSGSDATLFGFVKATTYAVDYDDYTDAAFIGNVSGDIKIATILNNAATTVTDTTQNWADTTTRTLKVRVSAAGVVTYEVDGAAPTATAAFTFDTGDVVKPLIYVRNATDILGKAECTYLKIGYDK